MFLLVQPARPSCSSLDNVILESDWCRDGTDNTFCFPLGLLWAFGPVVSDWGEELVPSFSFFPNGEHYHHSPSPYRHHQQNHQHCREKCMIAPFRTL